MEGFNRGRKSLVRKLSTNNGSCFLCLQTCEIKMEGETEEISKPNANLRRLLRYLQISVNSENTSKKEAEMDVEVDLCESCGKLHEKFSKLFQNLEKLLMELNFNLNEIHHRVSNSEKIPELVQISCEEGISDPKTLKLMGQLRKDIACKSLSKSSPKVKLTRATLPNVAVVLQNAPETDPLEDIHFEEPISPPQPDPLSETEDPLGPDPPCNPKTKKTPKKELESSATSSKIKKCRKDKDSRMFRCTYDQCDFQARHRNGVYGHYKRNHLKKTPRNKKRNCNSKRDVYWRDNPETGLFHCTKCEKTSRQTHTIIQHYQTVHLQKEYKCNVCNSVFTWAHTLRDHGKTCQQTLERRLAQEKERLSFKFVCIFCDKRFETKYQLRAHEKVVHPNNKVSCEICNKKFKHNISLQQHLKVAHLGKRFSCRFCNKTYRSPDRCRKHQRTCTGLETPIEGKTSPSTEDPQAPESTASEVQTRLEGKIEGVEPPVSKKCKKDKVTRIFHCGYDQCEFKSIHQATVYAHYNRLHLKKRYKCEDCKKEFAFPANLARHVKICGLEVKNKKSPVFCELCGELCESQEILNCHQLLEHKDSK